MTQSNADKGQLGLAPGTKIGKYEVVEKIGAGGQSTVYKCYDALLDRYVAAKQVSSHLAENPGFVEHFRQEARVLAKLGSEQRGIVTIHDLLEDEHGLFIVMEYVEGQTLESLLSSAGGPLATKPAAQLLWRLAGAMSAVHHAGIIHRDLKPSNVIVGEGLRPTITDFGVAASLSGQTSMLMGTTKYMAPELFSGGEVDGRTDMYSLGFIIYELLLGRERFNEIFGEVTRDPRTSAMRWMKWHGNMSVCAPALHSVNPAIPKELSDIVGRMISKDLAKRYLDMEALGQAIRSELSGVTLSEEAVVEETARPKAVEEPSIGPPEADETSVAPLEETPTVALPKPIMSKRMRMTLAIAAGAAIVVLGVGLAVLMQIQKTSDKQQAENMYNRGVDAYKDGRYAEAANLFESVLTKYPETFDGGKSAVMAPLARAQEAFVNQDTATGYNQDHAAEEELRAFERKYGPDVLEWVSSRRQEIQDLRVQRQQQQEFLLAFDRARAHYEEGRFDEALRILARDLPHGLTPEQEQQAKQLKVDANRSLILGELNRLAPLVIDAARYYKTGEAAQLLNDIEKQISSEEAKEYLGSDKMDEWTEWLREYRGYVNEIQQVDKLESQVGKALEAGDPAAAIAAVRQLLAAREALASRFPPDQNAERIEQLTQDLKRLEDSEVGATYDKGMEFLKGGMGLLGEGKTNEAKASFGQARDRFAHCLVLTGGDYPSAKTAMGELDEIERWLAQLGEADGLFVREQLPEAREAYRQLAAVHNFPWVGAKVKACSFNILVGDGKSLMQEGRLDEALEKFEQAVELDPSRLSEVAPYVKTIERMMRRADSIAKGQAFFNKQKWSEAAEAFEAAKKDSVEAEEINEVEYLLEGVEYSKLLEAGRRAMLQGQYKGARSFFMAARAIRQTEEVDALLEEVGKKIIEQGDEG